MATIQLIEDDALVRFVLQEELIDCGYLVVAVPEAASANEKLASDEAFDVELAAWVNDNAPAVLTLVMSGRHEAKAQIERLCKNATFFPKPFYAAVVDAHIQSVRPLLKPTPK